jgi:hypothetical protein
VNRTVRTLNWIAVAILGVAVPTIAVHRGGSISTIWLVVAALCCDVFGSRSYSSGYQLTWR